MIRPLLLHLANSGYQNHRSDFYALKRRLLLKHGTPLGDDVQEIVKDCYGYRGGDHGDFQGCTKTRDCKCGGSGTWDRRRYRLQRWKWGRFTFHVPMDHPPVSTAITTICGRIQHRNYGRLSREACFWLYLLSGELRLFWREFAGSVSYGSYAYPLLILQRMVNPVLWKLKRHTCIYCQRRFFTWGSGWCVCAKCRAVDAADTTGIPF